MVTRLLAAFGIVLGVACGLQTESKTPAGKETDGGFDAEAELVKEAPDLTEQTFDDGTLSFTAPGSAKPSASTDEGVIQFTIPIAEGGDVDCFLYEEDPDSGTLLLRTVNSLRKAATLRELQLLPIEVARESPVVRLVAFYTMEHEGGLALGQLKLAFHSRFDHASLCVHDQLGFSSTFRRTSGAFFETLETKRKELTPSFTEVGIGTIGDVPAGFDRRMIFRDGKQERRVSTNLLLVQPSATDLLASDSATSEVVDARGRIVSAEYINVESGMSDIKISLERKQGGQYHYQGFVHGKRIEGLFTHSDKRGLPGGGLLEDELKRRSKKPGAFLLAHPIYNPYEDPTRATDRIYLRLADDPPNRIRMKRGDTEVVGTVDADGRFENAEATIGDEQIRFQRAYQRGKP